MHRLLGVQGPTDRESAGIAGLSGRLEAHLFRGSAVTTGTARGVRRLLEPSSLKPRIGGKERQLFSGIPTRQGCGGRGGRVACGPVLPGLELTRSSTALSSRASDVPLGRLPGVRGAPGGASRGPPGGSGPPAAGLCRAAPACADAAGTAGARPDPAADGAGPRGLPADRRRQQRDLGRPAALLLRRRPSHARHPGRTGAPQGRAEAGRRPAPRGAGRGLRRPGAALGRRARGPRGAARNSKSATRSRPRSSCCATSPA